MYIYGIPFDSMQEDKMEKILVRIPKDLKDEIVKEAKKKGISINAQMLFIIWNWHRTNKPTDESL